MDNKVHLRIDLLHRAKVGVTVTLHHIGAMGASKNILRSMEELAVVILLLTAGIDTCAYAINCCQGDWLGSALNELDIHVTVSDAAASPA